MKPIPNRTTTTLQDLQEILSTTSTSSSSTDCKDLSLCNGHLSQPVINSSKCSSEVESSDNELKDHQKRSDQVSLSSSSSQIPNGRYSRVLITFVITL